MCADEMLQKVSSELYNNCGGTILIIREMIERYIIVIVN